MATGQTQGGSFGGTGNAQNPELFHKLQTDIQQLRGFVRPEGMTYLDAIEGYLDQLIPNWSTKTTGVGGSAPKTT